MHGKPSRSRLQDCSSLNPTLSIRRLVHERDPVQPPRRFLAAVPYPARSAEVRDGAVTGAKIAAGQVVKSLHGLTDAVVLQAGTSIVLLTNGIALQPAATVTTSEALGAFSS
jgi:hypothetical protein